MTDELIPAAGDAIPFCELCGQDGQIVNEQPADGGRAVWRRWTVSPMLVAWEHPALHPDPVTKDVRTWHTAVRCKDHEACRARVRAAGQRWDVADGHADPVESIEDPAPIAAAAGDSDPLWGAS